MSERFDKEYGEYLERATLEMGEVGVGQYVKFQGQLVKKLHYQEFEEQWERYLEVKLAYDEILQQGDTVNDAIVHLLREHASELLIKI
jgi:hypothetical protein